uniref:Mitochondrial import inner membrane translocase subunit Tim21 n=1 Tax=Eptatretus burgeri TaxID=7764 RepID=A0A8C4WXG9_EPTBU
MSLLCLEVGVALRARSMAALPRRNGPARPAAWTRPEMSRRVQPRPAGTRASSDTSGNRDKALGTPSVTGMSATQRVKQAGKDATYIGVIVVGLGLTGALLYTVFAELFSSWSPNRVYGDALSRCRKNPEVVAALGEPIKGYGETTRRGRRQHVTHVEFERDGLRHMRLHFYVQGCEPHVRGTVHLEAHEVSGSRKYELRYLFVELNTVPPRKIVIEDNR